MPEMGFKHTRSQTGSCSATMLVEGSGGLIPPCQHRLSWPYGPGSWVGTSAPLCLKHTACDSACELRDL